MDSYQDVMRISKQQSYWPKCPWCERCFYSVVGLLVWPRERLLGGEREEEHSLHLLWRHEGGMKVQYMSPPPSLSFAYIYHHFDSHRIPDEKWSASCGIWTCPSRTRSSAVLWSSRPSRAWRTIPWPTTPASPTPSLTILSLRSCEKVFTSAYAQSWPEKRVFTVNTSECGQHRLEMTNMQHIPTNLHENSYYATQSCWNQVRMIFLYQVMFPPIFQKHGECLMGAAFTIMTSCLPHTPTRRRHTINTLNHTVKFYDHKPQLPIHRIESTPLWHSVVLLVS